MAKVEKKNGHISIAAKLYGLLALLVVVMLFICALNLSYVKESRTDTEDLAEQQISDLKHVTAIVSGLQEAQKNFYGYLTYEDEQKKAEFLEAYEQTEQKVADAFEEFAVDAAASEEDYQQLMGFWDFVYTGFEGMQEVIALADGGASQKEIETAIAAMQETINAISGEMESMSSDCTDRINASKEGMYATFDASVRASVICLVLVLVLGVAIIFMTARVIKPIGIVTTRMKKMSEGDLHSPMPAIRAKDESRVMVDSVAEMTEFLNQMIIEISQVLEQMTAGDFTQALTGAFDGDFLPIKNSLNHILQEMRSVLSRIRVSSFEVRTGADQVAQLSESLAAAVNEQTSIVESISENISALTSSANENSSSAAEAARLSELALKSVTASDRYMTDLIDSIKKIEKSSQKIEKINKTMSDIAFQTNLLSLNASVEAARAGEAGKGFAVVAEEVKALAEKSSAASQDVSELIDNTVASIRGGIEIAEKTSESMNETVMHTRTVGERVDGISQMSMEQMQKLEHIRQSMSEIADALTSTAAASQESAATAQALNTQSNRLAGMTEKFKV